MEDDKREETNENESVERDESLLPAKRSIFSAENQPSSEAKKAGWLKRKRNRDLAQYLLSRAWNKNRTNEQFTDEMYAYFNITEEEAKELTYEAVIMLRQIAQAIKLGDMNAAGQLFERAFGKSMPPMPDTSDDDSGGLQINISVRNIDKLPPIKTSETDEQTSTD